MQLNLNRIINLAPIPNLPPSLSHCEAWILDRPCFIAVFDNAKAVLFQNIFSIIQRQMCTHRFDYMQAPAWKKDEKKEMSVHPLIAHKMHQ